MRKQKKSLAIILVLVFFILSGCQGFKEAGSTTADTSGQTKAQVDYWPTDEWRTSTPEEQGMDSGKLDDLVKSMSKASGIRSVLVVRHGYLVLESYADLYNKDMAINTKSVCKSVVSALTGIAVREKYIKNVNQNVAEFLPEYFTEGDSQKKKITIENLLTMTSGLRTSEPGGSLYQLSKSKDWIKHAIDQPMVNPPGNKFDYNTGLTHIMSAIITKTSGMSTLEFGNKYLFDPMGIKVNRWDKDPNGIYIGGAELELTPRDMAKFGYLYLNGGKWNGQQLIPEEWVESSIKRHVSNRGNSASGSDYGYWWWLDKDFYFANGWGGQFIIVNPKLDMVAVITAADQNFPMDLYKRYVLKAVKADTSIKAEASSVESMNAKIEELANPQKKYAAPSPELIEKINGKTFKCEKNEVFIDSFSLNFKDSSCTFRFKQVNPGMWDAASEFQLGMDGKYLITPNEYSVTYFGGERPFFPINIPGGGDKYPAAFKGHWGEKDCFIINCLWSPANPYNFSIVIRFDGDKVNVIATSAPTLFHTSFDGVMVSD